MTNTIEISNIDDSCHDKEKLIKLFQHNKSFFHKIDMNFLKSVTDIIDKNMRFVYVSTLINNEMGARNTLENRINETTRINKASLLKFSNNLGKDVKNFINEYDEKSCEVNPSLNAACTTKVSTSVSVESKITTDISQADSAMLRTTSSCINLGKDMKNEHGKFIEKKYREEPRGNTNSTSASAVGFNHFLNFPQSGVEYISMIQPQEMPSASCPDLSEIINCTKLPIEMLSFNDIKQILGKVYDKDFENEKLVKLFDKLPKNEYSYSSDWLDAFSLSEIRSNFYPDTGDLYTITLEQLKEKIGKNKNKSKDV